LGNPSPSAQVKHQNQNLFCMKSSGNDKSTPLLLLSQHCPKGQGGFSEKWYSSGIPRLSDHREGDTNVRSQPSWKTTVLPSPPCYPNSLQLQVLHRTEHFKNLRSRGCDFNYTGDKLCHLVCSSQALIKLSPNTTYQKGS
jgi:hypothetical protein